MVNAVREREVKKRESKLKIVSQIKRVLEK